MGARSTSGIVLAVGVGVAGVLGGGVLQATLEGTRVSISIPLTGVVLTTGGLVGIDSAVSLAPFSRGVPVATIGGEADGLVGQFGARGHACSEDVVVVTPTISFAEGRATVVEFNITTGYTLSELGAPLTGIAEGLAFDLRADEFAHLGTVVVSGVPYALLVSITGKHGGVFYRAGGSADTLSGVPKTHTSHITGGLGEVVTGRTALVEYGIPLANASAVIRAGTRVLTAVGTCVAIQHAHHGTHTAVGVEGRALGGTLSSVGVPLTIRESSAGGAGEGSGVTSLPTKA